MPGFSFMGSARVAFRNGRGRGRAPLRMSMAGATNSSKVTMVEMGLPGRPKIGFAPVGELVMAKTAGFPGRMATASKKNVGAECFQDVFDQIIFAHGDAAGQYQNILMQAELNVGA